jgi:putative SOS response-associated peptidase YedK
MCGRFVLVGSLAAIAGGFDVDESSLPGDFRPRYNIAPGQDILAVVRDKANRLVSFRWGLIPAWSKDPAVGNRMINARAETLAEKPSFRSAFEKRRCLVIANGFYEWRREGRGKIPVYISLKSGAPFGFAGLYETWVSPAGDKVDSCAIITTASNGLLADIHDRMPAIIAKEDRARWLDPSVRDKNLLMALLRPYPSEEMTFHDVSAKVNSPGHDSADLIDAL